MYLRALSIGAATYLPGVPRLLARRGTGGTDSARYCYDVWIKHLVLLWANGMRSIPGALAELGPGDSLGVGLAAMLCGVDHYYGLDVARHSSVSTNLEIFDDLVALLKARTPRPSKGWPDYDAYLDQRLFPSHILTEEVLAHSLAPNRLDRIRDAIVGRNDSHPRDVRIMYYAPWSDGAMIEKATVDVVISHAVLQSVEHLEDTYAALASWLKPDGLISHQIDFTCFRTSAHWNGHWSYSEPSWKMIMGKRPFLINREPHSTHVRLMEKYGFTVVCDLQRYSNAVEGVQRKDLAARWKHISEDDLACCGAFIQARKRRRECRAVASN
jgi:hypothetical protein